MYEVFDHTADIGIRAAADSLDELFVEAARALFSLIVLNANEIREATQVEIEIDGDDREYLLFDWLSELLYRYEVDGLLFVRFEPRVTETGLKATCFGEPVDRSRHQLDHEVKAITYHDLNVERAGDGWLAEVIVDI